MGSRFIHNLAKPHVVGQGLDKTPSGGGSAPFSFLLDDYPGAEAAFSLRKLRTAYAGSAIRVRRSSDSTEQDIGFVDNELDTASLLSFVGAGDGFVRTFYDQSGNGNDAVQASTGSQPKVVISGTVVTNPQGKPTVDTDAVECFMDTSSFSARECFCVMETVDSQGIVFTTNSTANFLGVWQDTNNGGLFGGFTGTAMQVDGVTVSPSTRDGLHTAIADGATHIVSSQLTAASAVWRFYGYRNISNAFNADWQVGEWVYYNSDESSNRSNIITNMTDYWG